MTNGSLDKIRRSVVTKATSLFVLALVAITFLIFPTTAFAGTGEICPGWIPMPCNDLQTNNEDNNSTATFMAAFKILNNGVSNGSYLGPNASKTFPRSQTGSPSGPIAPIAVLITVEQDISKIPTGTFVEVNFRGKVIYGFYASKGNVTVVSPEGRVLTVPLKSK